jgi:hypothetical protein
MTNEDPDLVAIRADFDRQLAQMRQTLNECLTEMHERAERRAVAENELAQYLRDHPDADLDALADRIWDRVLGKTD